MIRLATAQDAKAICDIYNYYIKNTVITFEEQELSEQEMQNRIAKVMEDYPWLVYCEDGKIQAYAYANQWKPRASYRYSVETTVYLHPNCVGKGIGSQLYADLIARLKQMDLHLAIGGITLPNPASVGLHEKFGFRKIGQFHQVGYKFHQWLDVGYWELKF